MPEKNEEKTPFAGLHHIGVIVKDVNRTMERLTALGMGPFEAAPMEMLTERERRGKTVHANAAVWFTRLGPISLELVQPLEGDSLQREFLEKNGDGVEHLGFFVDNLDEEVDKLVGRGWKVIDRTRGPNGGGFAFLQDEAAEGITVELVQPWM